jgi:signal transduction histidine kinase
MTELVKDLSRLEEGGKRTRLHLLPLIQRIVAENSPELESLNIEIELSVPDSLTLNASATHMDSLISNLFRNAVEAVTDVEHRKIAIEADEVEDHALIRVADSGIGVAPTESDKIFEVFYTTKPAKGTGLGLTIVKRIVDLYDGSISVTSTPGTGTEITIRFPCDSKGETA